MLWAAGMEIFQSEMIGTDARNHAPVFCQAGNGHPARSEKLADVKRPFLAKAFYHRTGQTTGNGCGNHADQDKGITGEVRIPSIAVHGVEHPDAETIMREIREDLNGGEPPELMM